MRAYVGLLCDLWFTAILIIHSMYEEPLQIRKDLGILNAVAYCFYLCGAHSIFTL